MNGLQDNINFFAVAAYSGGQGGYFSPHLVQSQVKAGLLVDRPESHQYLIGQREPGSLLPYSILPF